MTDKQSIRILAIETSCDETSVAVIGEGPKVLSNIISSQIPVHQKFGGVVPEIASRKHVELINPVIEEALKEAGVSFGELDAIAVTHGPGLVGALLVGLSTAKAIALALDIPLIGINHLEGHVYANFIAHPEIEFPLVGLVVSGGHTDLIYMQNHGGYEILGRTRDDAAGEAFDKVARAMGLGYPGGPAIDKLAREGDPKAIELPRVYLEADSFDFSFSGLKSAVLNYLNRAQLKGEQVSAPDLAASFQRAVTEVLITKTIKAAQVKGVKTIILAGGVAANRELREEMTRLAEAEGFRVFYPTPILCTDNAAMIGTVAYYKYLNKAFSDMTLNAYPGMKLGQ